VGERWYYLMPDPYYNHRYEMFESVENDEGITFSHSRKGRIVTCMLRNDETSFVYPPAMVRKNTGVSGYVLVSNFPFPWRNEDIYDDAVVHTPWFLDAWPAQELQEGRRVRILNGMYYDVEGPGTYLSRRARFQFLGKWAPVIQNGSYAFDRYSLTPAVIGGVSTGIFEVHGQQQQCVIYGEDVVVGSEKGAVFDERGEEFPMSSGEYSRFRIVKDLNAPFGIVKNLAYRTDLAYREGHIFVENRMREHRGLLRGYWLPLKTIKHGDKQIIILEPIEDPENSRVIVFKDATHRKRYYMQHVLHSQYWSRTYGGFQIDEGLVAAASKTQADRFLDLLSETETMSIQDAALVMKVSVDQISALMTLLKSQVFIVRGSKLYKTCKIAKLSRISLQFPGSSEKGLVNGEKLRHLLRNLFVQRHHKWSCRITSREEKCQMQFIIDLLRANRMAVSVREEEEVYHLSISC